MDIAATVQKQYINDLLLTQRLLCLLTFVILLPSCSWQQGRGPGLARPRVLSSLDGSLSLQPLPSQPCFLASVTSSTASSMTQRRTTPLLSRPAMSNMFVLVSFVSNLQHNGDCVSGSKQRTKPSY